MIYVLSISILVYLFYLQSTPPRSWFLRIARHLSPKPASRKVPSQQTIAARAILSCAIHYAPLNQSLLQIRFICSSPFQTAAMLLRAARSPCWRPARFTHPIFAGRAPWIRPATTQLRIFTTSGSLYNQSTDGKDPTSTKPGSAAVPTASQFANVEDAQQAKEGSDGKTTAKKDLLNESEKANKEQRKADWAIMREMAKYLWPKVMPLGIFPAGTEVLTQCPG